MSIRSAMSAGMTGLHAHSTSITVTGDNVANINTVGYRGSRAIFEDLLTRKITGIGQLTGTRLATIDKIFRQAAIEQSEACMRHHNNPMIGLKACGRWTKKFAP